MSRLASLMGKAKASSGRPSHGGGKRRTLEDWAGRKGLSRKEVGSGLRSWQGGVRLVKVEFRGMAPVDHWPQRWSLDRALSGLGMPRRTAGRLTGLDKSAWPASTPASLDTSWYQYVPASRARTVLPGEGPPRYLYYSKQRAA